MSSSPKRADPPLAGNVPPIADAAATGDPYEALASLMVAVEALCPVWPERAPLRTGAKMLL